MDEPAARTAYLAAADEWRWALREWENSGMAMDPGPDPDHPYEWTQRHWRAMRRFSAAAAALVEAYQTWDRLRPR